MEIKNLKKAAERIKKAIYNKEQIILYGDADLDGVSSVIILKESIGNLGGRISCVYFPDREKDGYGLTESALNFFKKMAPALLLIFDCGISSFDEVALAEKTGFEVIIVDHHEVLDKMPEASIIVDPKQKGDKYPFKSFATAGLAFKLSQKLLGEKLADSLRQNFLELAALATIADMMPEEADNKIMIEQGLSSIKNTFRPGLRVFFESADLQSSGFGDIRNNTNVRSICQEIISVLNIVEPREHLNATYLMLSANSLQEAVVLAKDLLVKREEKRAQIREITAKVEEKVLIKGIEEPIIFEGDADWPVALIGSTASRICNSHQKPTFIFKKGLDQSRGAVRAPAGINSVKLMAKCSKYLLSFGGHPPASGFAIKTDKLDEFKKCLINNL